ncbi:MAG TPA: DUF2235 domain-containing protein [Caulobacteraceae bacterium]|jgi:uncharacterized protein (DUF2235 family)
MKNIAIFCDGTWQQLDQPWPTNVAKLARAVTPAGASGESQLVYYDDGVGVSAGVLDAATHLIGGALGKGLDYKIVRAYEFLCLNYEPGDRIFIFGFSRGAYTARSLGGLIRLTWILKREEAGSAFEAMSLYRNTPPDDATAAAKAQFQASVDAFKAAHSHPGEAFTDVKAYDKTDPTSLSPGDNKRAWLQYVGVWETVGSLGIPTNLPFAKELDQQYRFHDTNLSRFVRSARHAVAIDERRKTFSPTLWTNIAVLNTNAQADALAYDERPYQQQWFPGTHGLVGGGSQDGGLSLVAMLWAAEGALRAGLSFDDAQLLDYAAHAHPDAPMPKDGFSLGEFIMELDGLADRDGPADFAEISLSARLRWAALPSYRPKPLQQSRIELDAWKAPANPRFIAP